MSDQKQRVVFKFLSRIAAEKHDLLVQTSIEYDELKKKAKKDIENSPKVKKLKEEIQRTQKELENDISYQEANKTNLSSADRKEHEQDQREYKTRIDQLKEDLKKEIEKISARATKKKQELDKMSENLL